MSVGSVYYKGYKLILLHIFSMQFDKNLEFLYNDNVFRFCLVFFKKEMFLSSLGLGLSFLITMFHCMKQKFCFIYICNFS